MAAAATEAPLFVKSYFADSVEDTLELARVELGPEALLLNERETPPETRHLGAFEVVFGVRRSGPPAPPPGPAPERAELRDRVRELREAVSRHRAAAQSPISDSPTRRAPVEEHLIACGVAPALASEVQAIVEARMRTRTVVQIGRAGQTWNPADLAAETTAALEARFEVAAELGRISAFIGTPGAGKTSALVKLALTNGLAAGRKVRLISTDSRRIGAAAQFQSYGAILGAPCAVVNSISALTEALEATPADTMVLIDTPGYPAAVAEESGRDLANFLRQRQEVDAHLVLTASMREADVRRTVNGFLGFGPAKLLFTRLDETEATGSMVSEAARTNKPISFLSTGPLIPEDFAPATKERIVRALVRQLPQKMQATI